MLEVVTETVALERLRQTGELAHVRLASLDLEQVMGDSLEMNIRITDCVIDVLSGLNVSFLSLLSVTRCQLTTLNFHMAYLLGGAVFRDCLVTGAASFEMGGHNEPGCPFHLQGCTFGGFVSFWDCWFPADVIIEDCDFQSGSNLLGNEGEPYRVQFDGPLVLRNVRGELHLPGG